MYKYSVQKDLIFLNNILRQGKKETLFSNKMILIMILFYF